jgi:hypothetical protein
MIPESHALMECGEPEQVIEGERPENLTATDDPISGHAFQHEANTGSVEA